MKKIFGKNIPICICTLVCIVFLNTPAWSLGFLPVSGFTRSVNAAVQKERWGKFEEAKKFWKEVLVHGEKLHSSSSNNSFYILGTARAYLALEEYEKAITLYENFLLQKRKSGVANLPGQYPWVYVYLGLAHAKQGDKFKALEYWESVPMTIGPVFTAIQEEISSLQK